MMYCDIKMTTHLQNRRVEVLQLRDYSSSHTRPDMVASPTGSIPALRGAEGRSPRRKHHELALPGGDTSQGEERRKEEVEKATSERGTLLVTNENSAA